MKPLTVTLDTTVTDDIYLAEVERAIHGLPITLARSTVTARERMGRRTRPLGERLYEPFVIGESTLGHAVLARDDEPALYEAHPQGDVRWCRDTTGPADH